MQYLKESFNKLDKSQKLSVAEKIIAELSKIKKFNRNRLFRSRIT